MDEQERRDRIVAALGGLAHSGTSAPPSSGSFAFTEPDIRKIISNWLDIARSYDNSITNAYYFTYTERPGLDYASTSFTEKAMASGKALVQHLVAGKEYCEQQAQLALDALNDYLGVEHMSITEFSKAQSPDQHTEV